MIKIFLLTAVFFFACICSAARVIYFQNGHLGLRSELPSANFTELVFPKLKTTIADCKDGYRKNWQSAETKGRSCDNLSWEQELRSGCESIAIMDSSVSQGEWSVAFTDKNSCTNEDLHIRNYSQLSLENQVTYKYNILLTGQEAVELCHALIISGAVKSETDGWTTWNLSNLANCRWQQDQEQTFEAKIGFK